MTDVITDSAPKDFDKQLDEAISEATKSQEATQLKQAAILYLDSCLKAKLAVVDSNGAPDFTVGKLGPLAGWLRITEAIKAVDYDQYIELRKFIQTKYVRG